MKKLFKVAIIFLIFTFFFLISTVKASSVDMDLSNSTNQSNNVENTVFETQEPNNEFTPISSSNSNAPAVTRTTSNNEDEVLNLENILSIVIIVIGIILIFLGIAIIIRCK